MEISTTDLVKVYRGNPVVNGISINIKQGEIVGLLGPNGAGKTTTFLMVVGLVKPNRGQVLFDGQNVTRQPMYRRARNGIAYLPQEASVFRNLTVEENLHLVLQMQNLSRKECKAQADRLLEDLHITHKRHDLGKTLSGGERRRVEIARALASKPKFILLDEPFTGVDPKAIEDIETIIQRLTKSEEKIGILITDHNVEAMLRIMERVYLIAGGKKRYEGLAKGLLDDPAAQEAYFGQSFGIHRDIARMAAEEELRRISHEYDTELDEMELEQEKPFPRYLESQKRTTMRLLDKLILKDLIGPFINGFLMFMMLVFAAGSLFQATEWLVQGIPGMIVLKLVLFSVPSLVTQVLPMAMLLAGLLGFGRLSADREIVAIFAAGISFPRASRIVLVMGALVSIVAYAWNDTVVPAASTAFWDLKVETFKHIGKEDKPLFRTIDSKDNKGVEELVTVNGGYDAKNHLFRRVNILKFDTHPERRGQPLVNIYCEQVHFLDEKGENATYMNGYFTPFVPDKKTGRIEDGMTVTFGTLTLLPYGATVGKSFEEVLKSDVTDPNRKSFRDLQADIQAASKAGEDVRGRLVDLYGKISLPIASFIFGIVGAALGCNNQRGGGKTVGFGTAIFIVFLYWVFYHAMFVVGKNGGLPPIVASFLADIVGAVVGIALAMRASR